MKRLVRKPQYQNAGPSAGKAKEMLRDGKVHGKKLTLKQKRYFGWIAGGQKQNAGADEEARRTARAVQLMEEPRLVDVAPEDYELYDTRGTRNFYKKENRAAGTIPMATGTGVGGSKYDQFIKQQLAAGIPLDELVQKKYLSPEGATSYQPFEKTMTDRVYTDRPPVTTTAASPQVPDWDASAYRREPLYDERRHLTGFAHYPTRQTSTATQQGNKDTRYQNVRVVPVKPNSADYDYSQGYYEVPSDVWNANTNPSNILQPRLQEAINPYRAAWTYRQNAGKYKLKKRKSASYY